MRFGLTKEHHDFFHHHQFIEFEGVLSPQEVESLEQALEKTLEKRLGKSLDHLDQKTLYSVALDGWRDSPVIKKIALRTNIAEVVSNFSKKAPLRIAADLMLFSQQSAGPLFKEPITLREICSVSPTVGGVLLNLSSTESENPLTSETPGSAIFFSPRLPLNFDYLSDSPHTCQLLLLYTTQDAQYIHNPTDPHTHALKRLDYVFGDQLRSETHPLVYRK